MALTDVMTMELIEQISVVGMLTVNIVTTSGEDIEVLEQLKCLEIACCSH